MPRKKLTKEEVIEIFMDTSCRSMEVIAGVYRVTEATVSRIRSGVAFASITGKLDRFRGLTEHPTLKGYYSKLESGTIHNKRGRELGQYLHPTGYLYFKAGHRQTQVHKFLLECSLGRELDYPREHCDHINRNKVDNRLANLRAVTPSVNQRNSKRSVVSEKEIKDIYLSSEPASVLAERYRTSLPTIYKIRRGVLNRDVTRELGR